MPFDSAGYVVPPNTEFVIKLSNDEYALAVLRIARHGISQPGAWCQDQLVNARGERCAMGWIQHVLGTLQPTAFIKKYFGILDTQLVRYNDHPSTDQRHIVAVFDRAVQRTEKMLR